MKAYGSKTSTIVPFRARVVRFNVDDMTKKTGTTAHAVDRARRPSFRASGTRPRAPEVIPLQRSFRALCQ